MSRMLRALLLAAAVAGLAGCGKPVGNLTEPAAGEVELPLPDWRL